MGEGTQLGEEAHELLRERWKMGECDSHVAQFENGRSNRPWLAAAVAESCWARRSRLCSRAEASWCVAVSVQRKRETIWTANSTGRCEGCAQVRRVVEHVLHAANVVHPSLTKHKRGVKKRKSDVKWKERKKWKHKEHLGKKKRRRFGKQDLTRGQPPSAWQPWPSAVQQRQARPAGRRASAPRARPPAPRRAPRAPPRSRRRPRS